MIDVRVVAISALSTVLVVWVYWLLRQLGRLAIEIDHERHRVVFLERELQRLWVLHPRYPTATGPATVVSAWVIDEHLTKLAGESGRAPTEGAA